MRFLGGISIVFICLLARAQVTGSLSGRVLDSSGAGIPQASVTITELDTGQVRSLTSDERGTYRALALPVGRYEVKAEQAGFKTAVRTGISRAELGT